jgi:hypothetical protein
MIFLTISQNDIKQFPNKTIKFSITKKQFIKENSKKFWKNSKVTNYYNYMFLIKEFVKPDGEDWSGVIAYFDAPEELHKILQDFSDDEEIPLEVRLLKSNGKYISVWQKTGDADKIFQKSKEVIPPLVEQPLGNIIEENKEEDMSKFVPPPIKTPKDKPKVVYKDEDFDFEFEEDNTLREA